VGTHKNECLDSDSNGLFCEKWRYNEVRRQWEGNPVLSPDVSDTVASIRHKLKAGGSQHKHSGAMKKEYMDCVLTWSGSVCPLDGAFNYLCFAIARLGSPAAKGILDNSTRLRITQHVEHLTFSAVVFMLWTRYINAVSLFLLSMIQCHSNMVLRNFELVKLKCGDVTTDDINAVNGVFFKYLQGEEASLTINNLNVYFEIHLTNRKGWQRKSDKGTREIDLHSASIHFISCYVDLA